MATRDLKDRYGEGNTRTIINRAIREELPGGRLLLQLLTDEFKRRHAADPDVHQALLAIRLEMENEIRRRYGMNEVAPTQSNRE